MSESEDLIARGMAASRHGDGETAIRLFEEATQAVSASAMGHFLLGCECAALARLEAAETAFAVAVLQEPAMVIARYQLGLLQFSTGRVTTALVTWDPLRALGEDHPLPRFVRGFAALAADEPDSAVAAFGEGMALNRDNAPLNDDIRKIIEQVLACGERSRAGARAASGGGSAGAVHVLLGSYGPAGSVQ